MSMNEQDGHTPTASVITVAYNSRADLEELRGQAPSGAEWIVMDNASSDGSADLAAELGASVLRSPRNLGFSAANNVAAKSAAGDVLIFCNPDVKTTPEGI